MSKHNHTKQPFLGVRLLLNRTPTGRRSAVAVRQAAHYVAYGQRGKVAETAQLRGEWVGEDGQRYSHEAVLAWGKAGAWEHRHTVHAVLSVPRVRLSADDYRLALAADETISAPYRLMVHEDTRYSHAHALFFWDKRMEKEQFLQWQAEVKAVLAERETAQIAAQELAAGQEEESGQTRRQAWELEI
jgi:hypothetical protein